MKLLKKDVNIIANNVWKKMQLNFNQIFNEINSYISLLNDDELINTNDIMRKQIILNNIIAQKQLRSVIIDGMILSDIQYAIKFFKINLYIIINNTLFKYFPNYQSNIYKYINNNIYHFFPDKYINIILKQISYKLKLWLVQCSKNELKSINKNVIYI